MKINKVVIPAAGLGTRFLPATKAMPKEMLPIVDKPTIQYIVEEAVKSGIENIIIITGKNKRAIEDHFDRCFELEYELKRKNQNDLLRVVDDISNMANMIYVRQKEPLGLGHAILTAKEVVGNDAFAVMLGDDIIKSDTPAIKQLTEAYEKVGKTILGVQRVPLEDTDKYGMVATNEKSGELHQISDLVEKPGPVSTPSDLAILGRYVITPEIFKVLERTPKGKGQEIQLTDALRLLLKEQDAYALEFAGKRYDVGDKIGFLKANCDFALERDDLSEEFRAYLKEL